MKFDRYLVKIVVCSFMGYALVLTPISSQAFGFQSFLEWVRNMQSELSAWSVTTKQTALAASQITQSNVATQQQLATAIGALGMSRRVSKALLAVEPTYGQPNTIKCAAQKESAMQVEAWQQVSYDRAKLMATFASERVADKSYAERERMTLHRDSFCTVSEAKSGFCQLKANGMQGWDVNYGGAFGERTLAAEGELAGYAYAAMVADTRAPAMLDCKSHACATAATEQLMLSAMGTMVADSLVGQVLERRVPVLTGK